MASVIDTSVKHFHSGMINAPVLPGTAGSLTTLLTACLDTGFDIKAAASLGVAGGVATLSFSGTHSATVGSVILVSGVTGALTALNGEQRVTALAAGVVKFATAAADGTAAGSISFKMAPAGIPKIFSGTNVAAYKIIDPMGTGMVLRVDDTSATNARVCGYETMSDVNTGTGPFQVVQGGGYWLKAVAAGATARPWHVFSDSKMFFLCIAPGTVTTQSYVWCFGDIISNKSGDAYGCVLSAANADYAASPSALQPYCAGYSAKGSGQHVLARSTTALGGALASLHIGALNISNSDAYSGHGNYAPFTYPNNADNGLLFGKVLAVAGSGLRGIYPGIYHVPQNVQDSFASKDTVLATGDLGGRTLMAMKAGAHGSSAEGLYGVSFFDVTGPWR